MGICTKNTKKKHKKIKRPSASSTDKPRRSQDLELKDTGLKEMRKLSCNDEAFHLPPEIIDDIIDIIFSLNTPTPKTYGKWDEYAISFYLKMCTCFGLDYQHLENGKTPFASSSPSTEEMSLSEQEENMECCDANQPDAKEISCEKPIEQGENMETCGANQPDAEEMSYEELIEQFERQPACCGVIRKGPFKFGSYSSGTTPDRIPYHLYVLVDEAVNIMKRFRLRNSNTALIDLQRVEKKIWFFCNYFHSHLPAGWNYNRNNASSIIANGYDTMGKRRDLMAGYTPIGDLVGAKWVDEETGLSAKEMAGIMSIVYSRKTPPLWGMWPREISFYCKICSCFGIDYQRLEDASEDDVCLMNTGVTPFPRTIRV